MEPRSICTGVAVILVLAGLGWVEDAGGQRCEVRLKPEAAVSAAVTLADLFTDRNCGRLRAAASKVRLGEAPLAGSDRVLVGEGVRELVNRVAAKLGPDPAVVIFTNIPERLTVRCAGLSCNATGRRGIAVKSVVPGNRPTRGRFVGRALVRRGELVPLLWDQDGIRVVTQAVALQAGGAGETVRARITGGGKTVRAIVREAGTLELESTTPAQEGRF